MSHIATYPTVQSTNRPAMAHINHQHLQHNYALLQERAGSAEIMAVVKANAYGHGIESIASSLSDAGCQSFAVTDAYEGFVLRQSLVIQNSVEITLLSGLFSPADAELASSARLSPIITEDQHIQWLQDADFNAHVWIKVDSGMNRMGAADPAKLIRQCREANISICGIMSHLACADECDHPMNQIQFERFTQICDEIAPELPRSLLNSAGMVTMPEHTMSIVRPGIALYGAEPVPSTPMGLKPVMSLHGSIMQLREVPSGTPVSYGASFVASQSTSIATVSLGYADGVPRALSGIGSVYINGSICPIIGRVCMDYTMIDVSHIDAAVGDQVEFWGDHILANDVATQLNTISYTLFTGVGSRAQRINGTSL